MHQQVLQLVAIRQDMVAESFFGWSRISNNAGSQSRIYWPTPNPHVQLDHFLHHTPKLGIPVEMVVSFEPFVETDFLLCTTI